MAKRLAEKHGFTLFSEFMNLDEHKQIASAEFQPALSRKFANWDEYFNRPYLEYAQWLRDTVSEDAEMVLMDLISQPADRKVVVDIPMPLEMASRVIGYHQIVFLITDPDRAIKDNFGRPDHSAILECIQSLPNPDVARKNVEKVLVSVTETFLHELYQTDWYRIKRDENSTVENTLYFIEKHFGLA